MLLVGESRHRVVRLRLEAHPHDPPFRGGGEHRQARAGDQIVDERGEEDRLAGARKPGHAEAERGAGKIVADRSGDELRLEDEIAETWQRKTRTPTRDAYLGGARRFGHPGAAPALDLSPRARIRIQLSFAGKRMPLRADRDAPGSPVHGGLHIMAGKLLYG